MSNESSFSALPERAIERLFARFAAMYGDAAMQRMFGAQSADAVKSVWAQGLARLDVHQLKSGIQRLEDSGSGFPPSLPEFIEACRYMPAPVPAAHRPALPPPPRTAEQLASGRQRVNELVAKVGSTRPNDPLAWAERVVRRYRNREPISHRCYVMACESLTDAGREVPR